MGRGTSPALMGWKPVASPCARPAVGHFLSILVPSRKAPPTFSCCRHLLPLPWLRALLSPFFPSLAQASESLKHTAWLAWPLVAAPLFRQDH